MTKGPNTKIKKKEEKKYIYIYIVKVKRSQTNYANIYISQAYDE